MPANVSTVSVPFDPEKRRRWLWAAGVFVFFLAVFSLSHDHIYYFDGLLQAGMINKPLFINPPEVRYEWNHFLWYPAGRFFYVVTHALGSSWDGYQTLQAFNTLIGAAGASVFFLILSRMAPLPWTALWTCAACLGQVYWYRSGGAENHLLGGVWCLVQTCFLFAYWEEPGLKPLVGMAAAGLLAAYFHLGNFASWAVPGLAVLARGPRKAKLFHLILLLIIIAAGWFPYVSVHHWLEPGGFSKWWDWSTSLAHGYMPGKTSGVNWGILRNLTVVPKTFLQSVLFYENWSATAAGWGILLLAASSSVVLFSFFPRRSRAAARDMRPLIFLIPFFVFFGFYAFWMPWNYMYWVIQWPSLCLVLGGVSAVRSPDRIPAASWVVLILMVLLIAEHNLTQVILPHKTNSNLFLVEMSRDIGRLTPPGSPVVISGRSETLLKPYIPYFAERNRLAIDLFALNAVKQNMDPIKWMNDTILDYFRAGVPVYITEDALRSKETFGIYGISPERVESVWKDYALIPIRDFPGPRPNRLYLMWTPALSKDLEDVMLIRLKRSGLVDQAAMIASARLSTIPPSSRKRESERLSSLIGIPVP
jgi:hypothetical protein